MLVRGINLPLTDSAQSRIGRSADGTLRVLVDVVQTALVEGVSAEEMDCGQVEGSAAGLAAAGLEHYWLGGQVVQFLLFGFCFGFVACYEAAVLEMKVGLVLIFTE